MKKIQAPPFPVRLAPDVKTRLEKEAKETNRSMNAVINQHVMNSLEVEVDNPKVMIQKIKNLVGLLEQSL